MATIIFSFVFLALVSAHPRVYRAEESMTTKYVVCNSEFDESKNEIIDKSRCGEPKEVFEELKLNTSYLLVIPSHVWVKRCVGLCDYEAPGSQCVATKIRKEFIPVRIKNMKSNQETCSMYMIDVHESCGCCPPQECVPPRVFNPRKCACQCPNLEERRRCLKQRNQHMRWNRSKCMCEKRKSAW